MVQKKCIHEELYYSKVKNENNINFKIIDGQGQSSSAFNDRTTSK
jgi:hypothetical protein